MFLLVGPAENCLAQCHKCPEILVSQVACVAKLIALDRDLRSQGAVVGNPTTTPETPNRKRIGVVILDDRRGVVILDDRRGVAAIDLLILVLIVALIVVALIVVMVLVVAVAADDLFRTFQRDQLAGMRLRQRLVSSLFRRAVFGQQIECRRLKSLSHVGTIFECVVDCDRTIGG